jgi:hypothetical protein
MIYRIIIVKSSMADSRKKAHPVNLKLPELRHESDERPRSKELTDPPLLKKGLHKGLSQKEDDKTDKFGRLADIFEKSQAQFNHIFKQILHINDRQEAFNAAIMEHVPAFEQG